MVRGRRDPSPGDAVPEGPLDVAVVEDVWGAPFEALAARRSVVHRPEAWGHPDELAALARRARALVVRNRTEVTRPLLERAPRLEVVARAGVGTDNVDLVAADELGVVVVAAGGVGARSVAEHALALALALARDLVGHDRRIREGHWDRRLGVTLAGRTWGVVGMGSTGTAVATLAASFGMPVIGYDPYLAPGADPVPGCRRVPDLLQLAAEADVVSLHVPSTPDTTRLVDGAFLRRMRPGAYLVNVARGDVVDEDALADALDAGLLAGAALDVRAHEPPEPGRLERHEHVLMTPHVAALTEEAQAAIADLLAGELDRVLDGAAAAHPVGRWSRPRPR